MQSRVGLGRFGVAGVWLRDGRVCLLKVLYALGFRRHGFSDIQHSESVEEFVGVRRAF